MIGMLKTQAKLKSNEEEYRSAIGGDDGIILILPVKIILCVVVGFVLSGSSVGGARSPLVISFVGTLSVIPAISAFIGAMLSFFVNGTLTDSVSAMTSMLALIFSSLIINDVLKKKPSSCAKAVITGIACLMCEVIISLSMKLSAILILAMICRAILCSLAAYFTDKVFSAVNGHPRMFLSGDNAVAASVVYVLMICAMTSVSFGLINAGRIVGIFVLMVAAYKTGYKGAAAVGVLTSFGIALASPTLGRDTMLLSFAGLAAGLFINGGRLSTASVFVAANMIGIVLMGVLPGSHRYAADVIVAAIIFFAVPEKWYTKLFAGLSKSQPAVAQMISSRLDFTVRTIKDIRQSTAQAGAAFDRRVGTDDISSKVCREVCSVCRDSAFCCQSDLHRAVSYFSSAEAILAVKGYIVERDLPKGLEYCTKKDRLVNCFNSFYKQAQMERRNVDAYAFMRDIALEQLISTEDLLKSINAGLNELAGCDDARTAKVRKILIAFGAKYPVVSVMQDSEGRFFIEAYISGMIKGKISLVTEKISAIFDREFSAPVINCIDKVTRIIYHEIPVYCLEIGACKKSGREKTSGDSQVYFSDGRGCTYFIISDGMGSGARAAVESCMTVNLLKKLIQAGVGFDCAFRLVNLLLLTKSSEEIFSTIDLLCINAFTGQADILKLGAAQTFIKSNGSVKCIESFSTPVGIISSIEFEHRTTFLTDGDCVVMISDGIAEESFPAIRENMMQKDLSVAKGAEKIIEVTEKNVADKKDDKSIFMIKICKI